MIFFGIKDECCCNVLKVLNKFIKYFRYVNVLINVAVSIENRN